MLEVMRTIAGYYNCKHILLRLCLNVGIHKMQTFLCVKKEPCICVSNKTFPSDCDATTANFCLFQIGTEEEPFQHKGIITMHGQVRAQELPVYGAKTLAVRHGTLELHGTNVTITHLEFKQVFIAPL